MQEFLTKYRNSFRSIREVAEPFAVTYERLRARRRGLGGKMSREVVYNSILAHYASLSLDEQLRIFDAGLAIIKPIMESPPQEEPAPEEPTDTGPGYATRMAATGRKAAATGRKAAAIV